MTIRIVGNMQLECFCVVSISMPWPWVGGGCCDDGGLCLSVGRCSIGCGDWLYLSGGRYGVGGGDGLRFGSIVWSQNIEQCNSSTLSLGFLC